MLARIQPLSGKFEGLDGGPEHTQWQPLVSILIPAFNAQKWIDQSIRSAIAQTWKHKEIIIIDDGSTDRTLAIAEQFASDVVHVVSQPHRGASSARNHAFSLCKGAYIQWLDADDLLAPDKIGRQIEAARQMASKLTLLSAPWATFLHRYYRATFEPSPLWCDLRPKEWLMRKIAQRCFIQTGSWLVSRQLSEAAGPWNTSLLGDDDGEYFCRVVLHSDMVRFVPEARAYYRYTGPGSLSYVGTSPEKLKAQWLSMKLHISYLRSRDDSPEVRTACLNYLQRGLIEFYPESREILKGIYELAKDLGGELEVPRLPIKYHWVQATLGWGIAKSLQRNVPRVRWCVERAWDKTMFALDSRLSGGLSTNGFVDKSSRWNLL